MGHTLGADWRMCPHSNFDDSDLYVNEATLRQSITDQNIELTMALIGNLIG